MTPHPALPADQLVTASDLVRHFGVWQDRAARAPLYILHRGRPRLVLTSIEMLDALCAAQPPAPLPTPHPTAPPAPVIDASPLLDAIGDLVLMVDPHGAIVASSRAARSYFGPLARVGAPIAAIVPPPLRAALAAAIHQVIDWGVGDRLETASAARAGRSVSLAIEPAGHGVAVIANDPKSERAARDLQASDTARIAALVAVGVAALTLDLDGGFVGSGPPRAIAFALDPVALADNRLRALVDDAARAAFDHAFDQVARGGPPAALDCGLRAAHGPPRAARIALAAIRRGDSVFAVSAIVLFPGQITDLL